MLHWGPIILFGKMFIGVRAALVLLGSGLLVTPDGFANEAGRQLTEFPYKPDMPAMSLRNTQGQEFDIRQLRQSVVVVNFWASWCPSCVSELRIMHDMTVALADKGVAVLAVNVGDNINMINHFFKDYQPAYQVLMDERSTTAKAWQIMGLPTTYVIGPDRKIHYGAIGVLAWESEELKHTILNLRSASQ